MTLSYALEKEKGGFFGMFWFIFNLGGVIGGLITLGINLHQDEGATSIHPSTYFTFCGLMVFGAIVALVRSDIHQRHRTLPTQSRILSSF